MKKLLNISIDDVSPHVKSSTAVLQRCYDILKEFPDAKFTLFIPAAYWRTVGETATAFPLAVTAFNTFCDELLSLSKDSFELCYHGLYHGIPFRSNNDEFANVTYENASSAMKKMLNIIEEAGLAHTFKKIIRPPAWRMCPNAFIAAQENGFEIFALSPDEYVQPSYAGFQKNIKHIMMTSSPPYKPLALVDKTEIVYHACEWDKSYLSIEQTNELLNFLKDNRSEFEFCFISDLMVNNGKV